MSRRPFMTMLALTACATMLIAGCGGSTSSGVATSGSSAVAGSGATTLTPPSPSASVAPTASPTPEPTMPLAHVDAALEDKLPKSIGGVQLVKFSLPLSSYIASSAGGDKSLFTQWLVKLGKTPDDVNIAIAADLSQTGGFFEQAIEVPGANAASLATALGEVARSKGWPTATKTVADKLLLVVVDPAVQAAGGVGTACVYASGDVLYVIVTDDSSLLLEAAIKLK